MENDVRYDASQIKVIEGLEAVRRRPGMYVGSTGVRGLHHMVLGVVEHAVNETVAGRVRAVEVTLLADGGVRVADDGTGVPFGSPGDDGGPGLEERLSRFCFWRGPLDRNRIWAWSGGIDLAVVNALSTRTRAEVRRAGTRWVQEYLRGTAVASPSAAGTTARTGTTLTFRPDPTIFETVDCSFGHLAERFRELAFLYPGLDVTLTDERTAGAPAVQRIHCPGGLRDFVASLTATRSLSGPEDVVAFGADAPAMAGLVEVALSRPAVGRRQVLGYANGRATLDGGTHEEGFLAGLSGAVTAHARACGALSATDPAIGPEEVGAGLTAVVSVKLDDPSFEGGTRTRLGGAHVRDAVEEAVRAGVLAWLEAHPERAARLLERWTG
ncbi:DNA gyrase subunit B [Streptomyces sp. NPDC058052]|uniref:DNA gyrase subunit B n=1 Tax=Streptomyces sp. NPDC058052 TaxID=3346316 RepID=UPI0036E6134D